MWAILHANDAHTNTHHYLLCNYKIRYDLDRFVLSGIISAKWKRTALAHDINSFFFLRRVNFILRWCTILKWQTIAVATASVALFIKPLCCRLNIFFGYVLVVVFFVHRRGSHQCTTRVCFGGAVVAIEKYKMKFPLYFSRISVDSIRMHFNNAITLFIDGCQTTKQVHDFTVITVARNTFSALRWAVVYTCECVCISWSFSRKWKQRIYIFACLVEIGIHTAKIEFNI